jgi:hypothetical protein
MVTLLTFRSAEPKHGDAHTTHRILFVCLPPPSQSKQTPPRHLTRKFPTRAHPSLFSPPFPAAFSVRALLFQEVSAMADRRELVVTFGEMLIDFVPTVAGVSLAEAPAFVKAPGGAPANLAIAVSRLGGGAAFVGKLGDDEFGRMLAAILRDNGVDDGGVVFDAGARTALAFVTLRADGEREFMFYRNPIADMLLTADELNVELIKRVSLILWSSPSVI